MRARILSVIFAALWTVAAHAQPATVIGPVTPGHVPVFNSTTVLKDGGPSPTLLGNTTYFVANGGSDGNSCTVDFPCATIQHALNLVPALTNGNDVTINVAAGSYPESLQCPARLTGNRVLGGGTITILGDTTTPSNLVIGGPGLTPWACNNIGNYVLDGMRLTSTTGRLIDSNVAGATTRVNTVEFNQTGAVNQSIRAQAGAFVFIHGPASVISVTTTVGGHFMTAQNFGLIEINNTVGPAFVFPTALGSGINFTYANDIGLIAFDSGTTFTNAANWQGLSAKTTMRGVVQINPDLSTLPGGFLISNDGTGIITTNNQTVFSGPSVPSNILLTLTGVNFNAANTDNAIPVALPSGLNLTRFLINGIRISGASGSLTTSTVGVFTAVAAGGTAVVSSGTAVTVSTGADNSANNTQALSLAALNTNTALQANFPILYFRVQNPQGTAATANVTIEIRGFP